MDRTVKLYSLQYSDVRTYLVAFLFVIGNILLPQLCHLVPQGGITWLPIYFFTLSGAYKYGWKVGMLAGFLSAVICTSTLAMHGGFVLYNGGLTAGLTALVLIPILDFYKVKPQRADDV